MHFVHLTAIFALFLLRLAGAAPLHCTPRRLLHHPFFPLEEHPPPTVAGDAVVQPPFPSPTPLPQTEIPFSALPPPAASAQLPFFPLFRYGPPPPPSPASASFPANVSSLTSPSSAHSKNTPPRVKILPLIVCVPLFSIMALFFLVVLLRRHHRDKGDVLHQFPSNAADYAKEQAPPCIPCVTKASATSSEFLYLGTLINSRGGAEHHSAASAQDIGSPDLQPLPPLPRSLNTDYAGRSGANDEKEECLSATPSTHNADVSLPLHSFKTSQLGDDFSKSRSLNSLSWNSLAYSISPDQTSGSFSPPFSRLTQPARDPPFSWLSGDSAVGAREWSAVTGKAPQPPSRFLKAAPPLPQFEKTRPPRSSKPPLHWEKQEMAWIQGYENMPTRNAKDSFSGNVVPERSRNFSILLQAYNLTMEQLCEAFAQGNAELLGKELLGTLLKMAKEDQGEFLQNHMHMPFVFKRLNAMLYIASFDSEAEHIKRSFATLQSACEELKGSRMFLKLVEAVLEAGNRMRIGIRQGDGEGLKLRSLVKLVRVKCGDGKTTLLHLVVQDMISIEGPQSPDNSNAQEAPDNLRLCDHQRKVDLQDVYGLIGELNNVKKAAALNLDALRSEVAKLAAGINKINDVLRFSISANFSENMKKSMIKARVQVQIIQAQEIKALCMMKEVEDYFYGDKDEEYPVSIFIIVADFLSILDDVCKDVGKMNYQRTVNFSRPLSHSFAGDTKF